MESQITTLGTVLLGVFYALGYLLNRRIGAENRNQKSQEMSKLGSTDFMLSLTSTASQSTSLNIHLWERISILEQRQQQNRAQIQKLLASSRKKTRRIAQLEKLVQEVKRDNVQLLSKIKHHPET